MSEPRTDADQLRQENADLQAECVQYAAQVEALGMELAETNKGVVALYTELDDQAVALREATALKSRFLSYMSHEFRTPLGAIRSMTGILLKQLDGPLSDEQRKQVQFIQTSAVELTELINDLLDLAKIEAGRVSISAEWFEMVDLFAALRGMFKPLLAPESRVSLFFEEPADLPRIYTDHKKLSQILRNYVSNALKFTPEGEVHVTAQRLDGDRVIFSVRDTGIGIPEESQALIFRDFAQIDSPLQQKWRGTGLGLALCKQMAELLGGTVSMTSKPNIGSTFSVTIPIRFGEDAAPPPAVLATQETGR